jgi:hypothetical protein
MASRNARVHVAKIIRRYRHRVYTTYLLRRTYRQGKKVLHETLGNLSHLPEAIIHLIRRSLKGETFVSTRDAFRTLRSLPHGHVEAVLRMIRKLGLDALIASKPCRQRDLVLAMVVQRILFPCSKLATTRDWHATTLAEELGVADADENDLYAALDWLLTRQGAIEAKLAQRHLGEGALVLYDVSSSYYEGRTCSLAKFGHNRDGKEGRPIIVYGLLTDDAGRPVAVEVYAGNTGDPATVPDQVNKLRERFDLRRVVLAGDRGMLTETQIERLKEHPGLGWISCLRSAGIRRLMDDGRLPRSLFDERNLAEIRAPQFPGERLVACYNPLDGIYVVRTSEPKKRLPAADAVRDYKRLADVEQAFRSLKSADLRVRPIHHRSDDRVRAHILLCMLAYYVQWHLKRAWEPLLFEEENLTALRRRRDPVAAAKPSANTQRKKATRRTAAGLPAQSFATLLRELGTRCRQTCRVMSDPSGSTFAQVTELTPLQAEAFRLLEL